MNKKFDEGVVVSLLLFSTGASLIFLMLAGIEESHKGSLSMLMQYDWWESYAFQLVLLSLVYFNTSVVKGRTMRFFKLWGMINVLSLLYWLVYSYLTRAGYHNFFSLQGNWLYLLSAFLCLLLIFRFIHLGRVTFKKTGGDSSKY